jgi:hypothetical protein
VFRVLGRGRDRARYGNQVCIHIDRGWGRVYMGASCNSVLGGAVKLGMVKERGGAGRGKGKG